MMHGVLSTHVPQEKALNPWAFQRVQSGFIEGLHVYVETPHLTEIKERLFHNLMACPNDNK